MAVDSYSLCPGGRGKNSFLLSGSDQRIGADRQDARGRAICRGSCFCRDVRKQHPDCACLTEAKCLFQRMIGLWEEAYNTAKGFAEREPKNIVALTELATASALIDKPQEAVSALVDAFEAVEGDQFPVAIVQVMLTVGMSFFENSHFSSVAIAKQLQAFAPQDQASNAFLYRCLGSETVLMLKEIAFDLQAPESFPKKAEYEEAVAYLARAVETRSFHS